MRRMFKILLLLGLVFFIQRLLRSGKEPSMQASHSRSFAIANGQLFIDGQELKLPATLADTEALLGKPSRQAGVVDEIYLWDDLGLYAERETGGEQLVAVVFILRRGLTPFEPGKLFTGEITLDHARLSAETPLWRILAASRGPRIEQLHQSNLHGYELPPPASRLVMLTLVEEYVGRLAVSSVPAP